MILGFFARRFKAAGEAEKKTPKSVDAASGPPVTPSDTRYFGQYSRSINEERPIEIFEESVELARTSKNPETAQSRYELALEAYRAAKSFRLPRHVSAALDGAYATLRRDFPTLRVSNQVLGLIAQAEKKKRVSTKLKYLEEARQATEAGLQQPGVDSEALLKLQQQVLEMISTCSAASR